MLPLKGTMPLLRSSSYCKYPMRLQAEAVQNCTCGIPNASAASTAKQLVVASETTQVTGGHPSRGALSLSKSSLNGAEQFCLTEAQSGGMSCVASWSDGGRPSGMASKEKPGRPLANSAPPDRIKRRWLNSVLTKVMWKPLECRSLANCMVGLTWPCAGNGTQTAWGFWSQFGLFIFWNTIYEQRLRGLLLKYWIYLRMLTRYQPKFLCIAMWLYS